MDSTIVQPITIRGTVEKPNSSAPKIAATTTSNLKNEIQKVDITESSLSEQLYKSGRIRPTLSTGQFSNLSKNQCYISR